MNAVFGWSILAFLAVLLSAIPPIFMAKVSYVGGYWDSFKEFNLFLWGFVLGTGAITGLLVWALNLIGFIHW